ncbi:SDR family NAD(P)-dependent oxidoreductase [Novosphingobium sediminicola]|uniref:NAD(P)-dependent dehydrogenase (Short-subunit alcohol dehydrogenase family) n=1 Tax=Novosphingobium sediminicola TaxID=563162 RepID=A0A7W6CN46_9SPHN|nr:SDR family oxidoreductase [Novosphingobium sediminicola]MBB3957443.1 NAD(P)-dependent dehydrogenase (short-subunit alcohol dehydrogenase family) [Novosphingobium sediminicola]
MSAVNNTRAIYPSLAGKRVFISGGASGIGEGFVEAFVAQGAHVAFCDIAEVAGKAVAARLNTGANAAPVFFPCDLTDMAAVQAMMAQVEETLGGIDVVVNNAANDDRHSVDEVTPAYWDQSMAVNLRHQFFVAQAAVPSMKRSGGGAIINLGSISWHLGLNDLVIYQTAKAAIEGMTRGLARELGRDNIRVTSIIPGNVKTPRQEKWYTPEGEAEIVAAQCLDGRLLPHDVAALALFLASDDARLITGHEYWVDAGWR